jgi:protein disulfide-isomerase A1
MRALALLLLIGVIGLVAADDKVVVLTEANFDETLAKYPLVLVEFYAPWCGHCKKLEPEYSAAAEQLSGEDDVVIGKVDATIEEKLGQRFQIQGFPTIKLFRNGQPTEYNGGRSAKDFVSFIKKQQGPAVKNIASAADVAGIKPGEKADAVLVAYAKKGSDVEKFYSKFADQYRDDFTFYHSENTAEDEKDDTIVMYKGFDNKRDVYDGAHEDAEFRKWAKGNSFRLVDEIGPENYRGYVDRGLPIIWLFVDPSKKDESEAARAEFEAVAPENRELSFVWLNGVQYSQMLGKMGLSGNVMPSVAIETTEGEHFPFPEHKAIKSADLKEWLNQFKAGSLPAHLKSEAVPEKPTDDDNVHILVGQNFKDTVFDKDADVLVEFYAPWCGHCKTLTPIYAELATELKDVSGIKIAKVDATANDVPKSFGVQGFPTIKLVKAGDNEVVDYNGARTKTGFIDFLKQNAVNGKNIGADTKAAPKAKGAKGHDEL